MGACVATTVGHKADSDIGFKNLSLKKETLLLSLGLFCLNSLYKPCGARLDLL